VFTRETSNVKREIEQKFSKSRPKLGKFWRFWGLEVRGFKKLRLLLQKARPCVNPRRLSHFASKSVDWFDLQVGWGKNRESHRDSHRKDMSPLTQGLNYRSACDTDRVHTCTHAHTNTQYNVERPGEFTHPNRNPNLELK